MAFDINYMGKSASSGNIDALTIWNYNGQADAANDTLAEIIASGYFNDFMQNLTEGKGPLQVGDVIVARGSDAAGQYLVTSVTTNVTLSAFAATGSVGTANLDNGAVTLAKLATGVTPSHVIKFGGQVTTSSGVSGSTHVLAIAGAVAATDRAFVQVVNDGTANVTVIQAVVTTDTLTVTFSDAPGADVTYNYQLIRAAS